MVACERQGLYQFFLKVQEGASLEYSHAGQWSRRSGIVAIRLARASWLQSSM
jgi:hypothetical protein